MDAPAYHGVGVGLQTIDSFGTAPDVLGMARAAEAEGLDHVWIPDHLLFHRPILEAVTTAAAVVGATTSIGIGFAVLNGVLRPPVWLAKQLSTLAVLAGDRLTVGIGLGGEYAPEFEAAGIPLTGRGRRLDAALDELGELLRGEGVGLSPVPERPPPMIIGGRSEAALRRAARVGDAWLPMWMDPDRVAAGHAEIAEMAREHERPAPGLVYMAFVNVADDAEQGRAEAAQLVERQYGMPFDRVERWALIGDAEEIAERLRAYRDVGAAGFVLAPATPDPITQVDGLVAVREALLR